MHIHHLFALLLLLLPFCALHTQEDAKPSQETSTNTSDSIYWKKFPEEYIGVWKGNLDIFTSGGRVQAIPMELHILAIDDTTYTYTIIYGEDKEAGKRAYLLRAGAEGPHHWIIDEQDGILLDNFYVGGILHGPFTVMGSRLYNTLERTDTHLVYTIMSGSETPFRSSGTTISSETEEEQIDVSSFDVKNVQRAFLQKE